MTKHRHKFWATPTGWAALALIGAPSYFLFMEHREHLFPLLPYLILLLCPLMHLFMHSHHGHGEHKHHVKNIKSKNLATATDENNASREDTSSSSKNANQHQGKENSDEQ